MRHSLVRSLVIALHGFGFLAACSGGAGSTAGADGVGAGGGLVGGACTVDADCRSQCVGGDHYPGGMCTVSCRDDGDCPSGTSCIDDKGGVCAVGCRVSADCDGFGRGYTCHGVDRHGADGEATVCSKP